MINIFQAAVSKPTIAGLNLYYQIKAALTSGLFYSESFRACCYVFTNSGPLSIDTFVVTKAHVGIYIL